MSSIIFVKIKMSNIKKQRRVTGPVVGLVKMYAEQIRKISQDVLVLENKVNALVSLHKEEDTGLSLENFSPVLDSIIPMIHQHCLVAEICSSYVDNYNTIKYIVKLSNLPVQYVVQIRPER